MKNYEIEQSKPVIGKQYSKLMAMDGVELQIAEDGLEVLLLVLREQKIVMRQLWILAVEAEIENQSRAGRLESFQRSEEFGILAQQASVGRDDLHVGDDDVENDRLAVLGRDARNLAAIFADLHDFGT